MVAVFPSGWTGLLPGSLRRVPVAETHSKKGRICLKRQLTLFIDGIRDVALLTFVHVEDTLLDAACGLLKSRIRFFAEGMREKKNLRHHTDCNDSC